jgi:hypothetical protein
MNKPRNSAGAGAARLARRALVAGALVAAVLSADAHGEQDVQEEAAFADSLSNTPSFRTPTRGGEFPEICVLDFNCLMAQRFGIFLAQQEISASGDSPNPAVPDGACARKVLIISGRLTLKDSEPGAWWAVTDDSEGVWKIASPTPEQVLSLEKAQNQRISVEGCQLEKDLNFEQIELLRIIAQPNP